MKLRTRIAVIFLAVLFASLGTAALLQGVMAQGDREQRAYELVSSLAADIAQMRGALEDGLIDQSVYLGWLSRMQRDESLSAWLVDARGIILPPDFLLGETKEISMDGLLGIDIETPFSIDETEQYVLPALRGESATVTGTFSGRLEGASVTAIEPVARDGGFISGALFVHRRIDALEQGDLFIIWRQSALAALIAAALGAAFIAFQSLYIARPYQALVSRYAIADEKGRAESERLEHALKRMTEQIDDLEELRRGFVANVSHELRTPLTNIVGYLQGIVDGAVDPRDTARFTAVALDEAKRMSALIGGLLNLSRLESGRFALHSETFDLCELLRRALVASANAAERVHIAVDLRADAILVEADPQWIRLAVDNLLGNAFKFAGEGGSITLRAQTLQDRAYVTIADDGPGISDEDLPHVFEWFYMADKAHAAEGTGLGLAIVKSVMDRHGQAVRISSRLGRGTIVTFSLALHRP